MAEKIVEMSKLAPFGLKRPTAEDIESLNGPSKKCKIGSGLWTHETRMFDEITIYLNKSTTKYVIIGIDPETFDATMKICDRTTGAHISISTGGKIIKFCQLIAVLLNGDDFVDAEYDASVLVTQLPNDLWKITPETGHGSIVLHKISLENFSRSSYCIEYEAGQRQLLSSKYAEFVKYLRNQFLTSPPPSKARKLEIIEHQLYSGSDIDMDVQYPFAFGLVTHRPYLETLESYAIFYN